MNKILTKIFGDAGVGIVDKLAGVADRFIRTKDEKAKFQKEMEQIWIQAESDMQDYHKKTHDAVQKDIARERAIKEQESE